MEKRVVDKFTKLIKIGVLWNILRLISSDFLQKNLKSWLLSGQLGTRHQIQAFEGFSLNFLISENPKSKVVLQLTRQLVHLTFGDNNLGLFHLW